MRIDNHPDGVIIVEAETEDEEDWCQEVATQNDPYRYYPDEKELWIEQGFRLSIEDIESTKIEPVEEIKMF